MPIGSPVKLTYKFVVAPNAKIERGLLGVRPRARPGRASSCGPTITCRRRRRRRGSRVRPSSTRGRSSSRTIRTSARRPCGWAFTIGPPTNRLTLNAPQVGSRRSTWSRSSSSSRSRRTSSCIYKDGWHPAEVAADNPASEWQWTKKTATISFRNPKKDATFYLEFDARTDLFTPPQQVTLRIGTRPIATFAAANRERKLVTFPITAAQLGAGTWRRLVDRRGSHVQSRRRRLARAGHSGVPRLRRAEVIPGLLAASGSE